MKKIKVDPEKTIKIEPKMINEGDSDEGDSDDVFIEYLIERRPLILIILILWLLINFLILIF